MTEGPQPAAAAGGTQGQSQAEGAFDCNICLELSKEPVVTMCGHLFCWPCIYRRVPLPPG